MPRSWCSRRWWWCWCGSSTRTPSSCCCRSRSRCSWPPGVAPFLTSNPMNTVVAGAAGIDFNSYASRMVPVALVAAAVTFLVLRWVFATELRSAPPAVAAASGTGWTGAQRWALALVLAVLIGYPAAALAGLHVFVVAGTGAVLALAWRGVGRPAEVLRSAVAWEIIVFLLGMFVLAKGLQNVGVVERLRELYETGGGTAVVGVTSAAGSALINNHSMALANLLAIQDLPGAGEKTYLAALVGGDLGPRVLPIGSLVGLLWLTLLGRLGVEVPLRFRAWRSRWACWRCSDRPPPTPRSRAGYRWDSGAESSGASDPRWHGCPPACPRPCPCHRPCQCRCRPRLTIMIASTPSRITGHTGPLDAMAHTPVTTAAATTSPTTGTAGRGHPDRGRLPQPDRWPRPGRSAGGASAGGRSAVSSGSWSR
ncbi:MAG: hypothetical protein GEV12_10775 [Micromonosporaceae bacterium]|nr:hypothetical protein [Micromonosporaceae bacterium]